MFRIMTLTQDVDSEFIFDNRDWFKMYSYEIILVI